ncbi:MAG: hypothetical protein M3Y37_05130, partial [Chloroflexota bacterium]|nr:hypothetical protein [Chloroflexota bacterium]
MSRYHSPYASRKQSSRWPILLAVMVALLIGVGVGVAASGGFDLGSLTGDNEATSTPRTVAAADDTETAEPTEADAEDPTATESQDDGDEPTATESEDEPAPTETDEPTEAPPSATQPPTATETPAETPTPDAGPPEQAGAEFANHWSTGEYRAMYAMLSADSKAAIPEADFVDRLNAINTEVGITEIQVEATDGPDLDLAIPIEVTYVTGTVGT